MTLKTCSRCAIAKPLDDFARNARGILGRHAACKLCINAARKARYAADDVFRRSLNSHADRYRAENREALAKKQRDRIAENPEKHQAESRRYYEKHREKVRSYQRKWSDENREIRRQKHAAWLSENPTYYADYYRANVVRDRAKTASRRARRVRATPPWADLSAIANAYEACDFLNQVTGEWHHVDHIVPLKHPLVCGLHVAHNLQILTASDNLRKSNRYEV